MSNQDMITAIVASIQTDANLIILLKALIAGNIVNVPTERLVGICNLLGIPTS